MYTEEQRAAIYGLGKSLWFKAWKEYQRTGYKPVPLMELAKELAKIAADV